MTAKILELDIETAPNLAYVWGLFRENIPIARLVEGGYTMCWSAKWYGKRGIMFSSIHKTSRTKMLDKLHRLLDEADIVIHYNGKRFDIPTINREFVLEGFVPPSPYKQIDLLKVVRKNFRFPSNKLDYVVQALGIGQKVHHIGYELWTRCMHKEDKAWKQMELYNKGDVLLLDKLYKELLPWITNHPNMALYGGMGRPVCTNCSSTHVHSRGTAVANTQIYKRYQCVTCGTWMRSRQTEVKQKDRAGILVQEKI